MSIVIRMSDHFSDGNTAHRFIVEDNERDG